MSRVIKNSILIVKSLKNILRAELSFTFPNIISFNEYLIRFTSGEWVSLRGQIEKLRHSRMNADESDTSDVACVLDGLRRATEGMQ